MFIVASAAGVTAYNMEDGNEASSLPGVNAAGAGVSYFGKGDSARGVLAFLYADRNVFKFYDIDNVTRDLNEIATEIPVRGNVRGFCFGRAMNASAPSLYVVQKGELTAHEFAEDGDAISTTAAAPIAIPDATEKCAVDIVDGSVLLAAPDGQIFRLAPGDDQVSGVAIAPTQAAGDIAALAFHAEEGAEPSVTGLIALLDQADGVVHLFDREDGHAAGAVRIVPTDDLEGVSSASVMGAVSANLGGLYRHGVIALGVDAVGEEAPTLRLISVGGVLNALQLDQTDAVEPRGVAAAPEEDDSLIIAPVTPE